MPAGCPQAFEFIAPGVHFGGFGTVAGGERANDIEDSTKEEADQPVDKWDLGTSRSWGYWREDVRLEA